MVSTVDTLPLISQNENSTSFPSLRSPRLIVDPLLLTTSSPPLVALECLPYSPSSSTFPMEVGTEKLSNALLWIACGNLTRKLQMFLVYDILAGVLYMNQDWSIPGSTYHNFPSLVASSLTFTHCRWPHSVILEKEGPNDGLVSVESSKWVCLFYCRDFLILPFQIGYLPGHIITSKPSRSRRLD